MSITFKTSFQAASPEASFRQLVEFGPDVMIMLRSDGLCMHVSPASLSMLGQQAASLTGTALQDLVVEDDREAFTEMLGQLRRGAPSAVASFRIHCVGGSWIWAEAHARQLPADAGMVISLRDITIRKQDESVLMEANELLRRRATLDPVTCLPNRGHFFSSLERELRRAHREETSLSLLVIGIDDMRQFNNSYGRDAGDLVLREVAAGVERALCRPGDQPGRLTGAMIGVVLPGTELEEASAVAQRVRDAVAALKLEHANVPCGHVTVTVGIATCYAGTKGETLLQEAICEMEVARAAMVTSPVTV